MSIIKEKASIPARGSSDMPTLNGCVVYKDGFSEEPIYGLYSIPTETGPTTLLFEGPEATAGGVAVNQTYYSTCFFESSGKTYIIIDSWDVITGEYIAMYQTTDLRFLHFGATVDPTDGTIYAITYNERGTGCQLSILKYNDIPQAVTVAPLPGNWNSLVCDSNGQLFGIRYEGHMEGENIIVESSALCRIDKKTGTVSEVGETGLLPKYASSATIDIKTDRMFWNVCPPDNTSLIAEVNLQTGEATPLYNLTDNAEIMGMFVAVPAYDIKTPGYCDDIETVFEGASLSGIISLTTPSTFYGGVSGTGDLNIRITCSFGPDTGKEFGRIEHVRWGDKIEIPVTVSERGVYRFDIVAYNGQGDGPRTTSSLIYIGPGIPKAPAPELRYEDGRMELSWEAVTKSDPAGFFIDSTNLTYTVCRHDGTIAASHIKDSHFSESVIWPENGREIYSYTVTAECNGMISKEGTSNYIGIGDISIPYISTFNYTGLDGWTVIDANEDGNVWEERSGKASILENFYIPMDDWLISPGLKMEEGKVYRLTFKTYGTSPNYPERIEVKYGSEATIEGMTDILVPPTIVETGNSSDNNTTPMKIEAMIIPIASGNYHVGFHGISDPAMARLYVDEVRVELGVSPGIPDRVSDLTAVPDPSGAYAATISFRTPEKTLDGRSLSSISSAVLSRGDQIVKTFLTPQPGEMLTFTDELTEGGEIEYSVICTNSEGSSFVASVSTYVGYARPAPPSYVSIARTAYEGEVTVSWPEVTQDVNGLVYPPGEVRYIVVTDDNGSWLPVSKALDATSYSFCAVQPGVRTFVQGGVIPVYGESVGIGLSTEMIPVGPPYQYIKESFSDCDTHTLWSVEYKGPANVVVLGDDFLPSQDGDNGLLAIKAYDLGGANLMTHLISLDEKVSPYMSFYTYNIFADGNRDINEISVCIRTDDNYEWTPIITGTVDDLCCGNPEAWGRIECDLSDYMGSTVQIQFAVTPINYQYTMLDNIEIGSSPDNVEGIIEPTNATIEKNGNVILIRNAQGMEVTVATTSGTVIFNGTGESRTQIPVDSGIYIIKVGNLVKKILI